MKPQKRWMKSVIATSKTELPALPWARKKSVKAEAQRRSA